MKRKTKQFFLFLLVPFLLLSACFTGYEREGIFTNGYSDYQVSENTFVITFRAHERTPKSLVMKYTLQRAAELTLEKGYSFFIIKDQQDLKYPATRLVIECLKEDQPDAIYAKDFFSYKS